MITVIDYGMGNLGSVVNMFHRIGHHATVSKDLAEIGDADKLLLPGVGAFDAAMKRINDSGLREVLDSKANVDRVPILGICLGMQLLTDKSEEGQLEGLGWIKGSAKKFPMMDGLKVPHMGWNLTLPASPSALTRDLPQDARFYFVHSYYVQADDRSHSILRTQYGIDFDSGIGRDNIYGAQFHPEKSHKFGMSLLKNFADL